MFFRITGARWQGLSTAKRTKDRRETSAGSRMESLAHPCRRVSVFKRGPPRAGHKFSGPERFVLAVITIELPASQTTAGIDNFPVRAAKDALNFSGRSFEHETTMQAGLRFRRRGKSVYQRSCSAARRRRNPEVLDA